MQHERCSQLDDFSNDSSCESIRKWELNSGVGGSEAYSTKEKVQTKARACAYTNHLCEYEPLCLPFLATIKIISISVLLR